MTNPPNRIFRWLATLADFKVKVCYLPGKENVLADALSRPPLLDCRVIVDDVATEVFKQIQGGKETGNSKLQCIRRLFMKDGSLYRRRPGNADQYVPLTSEERTEILNTAHTGSGHLGLHSTTSLLLSKYWWPSCRKDIADFIKTCTTCQAFNVGESTAEVITQHKEPIFATFGIDFVGPLPVTNMGNKYLIVATESLTRWPIAKPTADCTASTAAEFIFSQIVCTFGPPSRILTDRGTHFNCLLMEELLSILEIRHQMTSAYHPQTNGMTERFNGTLCKSLGKMAHKDKADWDEYVEQVLFHYRIRPHSSTGRSPFELLFGVKPTESWQESIQLNDDELETIRNNTMNKDNNRIFKQPSRMKKIQLKLGQLVWVKVPPQDQGKLQPMYKGPFKIVKIAPFHTYGLEDRLGYRLPVLIHVSRLKPYHESLKAEGGLST